MKVLSISSDRKIFQEGSTVRARMVEYGTLFDELHIVIFSKWWQYKKTQIAPNVWAYPTHSLSRWFYISGAISVGKRILRHVAKSTEGSWVIDAQDPFECGRAAYVLSKRRKIPLHIQIHTDFLSPYFKSSSLLNRVRVFMARKILRNADAIRVVSQKIRDSLVANSLYLKATPIVLPIFTDVEKLRNTEPTFNLQEKYKSWGFIIVVVARFTAEKNVVFALKILKKLLKNYPTTGLVLIGDGPLKNSLKRRVFWSGLRRNVVFEGWKSDTVSYYKTANLFLQTSLYEGFGLALLEALACGLPAVSTDVGIAPELLNHKGHSFDCKVGDMKCFVSTISELIEDNQLRTFYSLQIAPYAVEPFIKTKAEYLEAYKNSISEALNHKKG